MPQPTPYDRITNFQNEQALAPTAPHPAPMFDAEYNAIKITIDEILQNLALIQRDDGQLANDSVGLDQLREEVQIGFNAPAPWVTDHDYVHGDSVFNDNAFWFCLVDHKSGVFATDLAAGYWSLIADFNEAVTIGAKMYVSDGPPPLPTHGQQWFESDTGNTYLYYVDAGGPPGQWVHINGTGHGADGGAGVVATSVNVPFTTESFGTAANISRLGSRTFSGAATVNDGGPAPFTNLDWYSALNLVHYNGGDGIGIPGGSSDLNYATVAVLTDHNSAVTIGGAPQVGFLTATQSIGGHPGRALENFAINNAPSGNHSVWAGYTEAHRVSVGATTNIGNTYCFEIEVRNSVDLRVGSDPYQDVNSGTYGLLLCAGCGLSPTGQFDATAAISIGSNPTHWGTGLLFKTGSIGAHGPGGTRPAIALPADHDVQWYASAGVLAGSINGATFGAWTAYTPTVTGTGGFVGTATGRYKKFGKTIHVSIAINVTTGGQVSTVTLPIQAAAMAGSLVGRVNTNAFMWLGHINASSLTAIAARYDADQTMTSTQNLTLSGAYECI